MSTPKSSLKQLSTPSPAAGGKGRGTPSSSSSSSSRKNTPKAAAVELTSFQRLLQEILHWREVRLSTIPIVKDIVNLRNQSSHVSNSKVSQVLGGAVKPSRMTMHIHDSLTGRIKELTETQSEMLRSVERIASQLLAMTTTLVIGEITPALGDISLAETDNLYDVAPPPPSQPPVLFQDSSSWLLDEDFTRKMVDGINQQTLLELCVAETLTMTGSGEAARAISSWEDDISIDSDVATTLLVCFSHPPYLPDVVDFDRLSGFL